MPGPGTSLYAQYQAETDPKKKGKKTAPAAAPKTALGAQYQAEQARNATLPTLPGVVASQPETPQPVIESVNGQRVRRAGTPGETFATSIGNGIIPGFLDEVMGAQAALTTPSSYRGHFGENYRLARDEIRGLTDQAHQEHPVASRVAEGVTGVATALPMAAVEAPRLLAAPISLGRQVAQGAKLGAATGAMYGGVQGAGDAEGSLVDRATGGAAGAAGGAAAGAVLGAVSPVVANRLTALKDLIGRRQMAAGSQAAADAKAAILSGITDPAERAKVEAFIANDNILGPAFNGGNGAAPIESSGPRLKARTGSIGGLPPGRTADNPFLKSLPGRPQGGSNVSGGVIIGKTHRVVVDPLGLPSLEPIPQPRTGTVGPLPTELHDNTPFRSFAEAHPEWDLRRAAIEWQRVQGSTTPRIGAISIRSGAPEEAVGGRTRAGFQTADERANQELLKVLGRDKQTPASIRAKADADKAAGANTPLTIADYAGRNTQGLLRAAGMTPSSAKDLIPTALDARASEATERLTQQLLTRSGKGIRTSTIADAKAATEAMQAHATPLYEQARAHGTLESPEVQEHFSKLLQTREGRRGYVEARDLAALKGDKLPKLVKGEDGVWALEGGAKPTVSAVDYTKQVIDDVINKGLDLPPGKGGLSKARAAEIRKIKNDLLTATDAEVPVYGEARKTYGSDAEVVDATNRGRDLFTMTPADVQHEMAGMSEAARDAFRRSGVEATADRLEAVSKGSSVARSVDDKIRDRKRLRALFPDQASYDEFRADAAREAVAHATRLRNNFQSSTADKLIEFADMAGVDFGALAQQVKEGNAAWPIRALTYGSRKAAERSLSTKADALAPKLLASGPELLRVLENLEAAQQRLAKQQGSRMARSAAASAGAGTATPKPKR